MGKTDVLETCPTATLSTISPTCIDLGSNPNLQGERTASDCLSHAILVTTKCHVLKLALHFESYRFVEYLKELQNSWWTLKFSGM